MVENPWWSQHRRPLYGCHARCTNHGIQNASCAPLLIRCSRCSRRRGATILLHASAPRGRNHREHLLSASQMDGRTGRRQPDKHLTLGRAHGQTTGGTTSGRTGGRTKNQESSRAEPRTKSQPKPSHAEPSRAEPRAEKLRYNARSRTA